MVLLYAYTYTSKSVAIPHAASPHSWVDSITNGSCGRMGQHSMGWRKNSSEEFLMKEEEIGAVVYTYIHMYTFQYFPPLVRFFATIPFTIRFKWTVSLFSISVFVSFFRRDNTHTHTESERERECKRKSSDRQEMNKNERNEWAPSCWVTNVSEDGNDLKSS